MARRNGNERVDVWKAKNLESIAESLKTIASHLTREAEKPKTFDELMNMELDELQDRLEGFQKRRGGN